MPDFKRLVRDEVAPLSLPPHREEKIVDEWAAQLEDVYEGLRAEGVSEEEAWRQLLRQLPDWTALRRELREAEPALARIATPARAPVARRAARTVLATAAGRATAGVFRDLRASARLFFTDPIFSATVVLTLAICLGANTAVFSVVDAVLLRPLPIPEPDRVVALGDVYPTITPDDILANDAPSYFDRLDALTTLEEQGLFAYWFDTLTIDGVPQELRGMRVTPSVFRVLGVSPALGRTFTDAEGAIGQEQKIILSWGLWQRLHGGDPNVIGQSLRLGWTGRPYTIVGVMPRGFSFFDQGYDGHAGAADGAQFWIPLAFTPEQKSESARTRYGFFHIGRLLPGATIEQVQAQADALRATTAERLPQFRFDELGMYTAVTPLHEALTRRVRQPLYLLWAGAGLVLLIGGINIANLSLARAVARRRELATRRALGAERFQVARQLMIEAMVPALLGAAAGVAVAAGMLRVLAFTGLELLPNAANVRLDANAIALAAALSAAVALLVGLVPVASLRTEAINQVLGEGSRSGTSGATTQWFRRALVVAQVALSVVLLVAATLLFTSIRHLLRLDAGFSAAGVVTATVFPPPSRYPDARAVSALCDQLLERLRAVPGVQAAGVTSNIALSGFESPSTVSAAEQTAPDETPLLPSVVAVSPGYFEAMGTPLVRGRYFAATDRHDTMRVAVVDERLAERLWPGADPIGKRLYRGDSGPFTVVGIVRAVRLNGLTSAAESIGTAYFPHSQAPPMPRLRWVAIKSAVEPAAMIRALRSTVQDIDASLAIADVQTMSERTERSLISHRLASNLATMFALVALVLSMLGIYGVLAHLVSRRTREIGIRMALGSSVRAVFGLVLAEGVALVGTGLLVGVAGAIAVAQSLEGLLFGVQPTDPWLLASVALATGGVALLACVAPARRATRVDPVGVLSEP